ncbi:MAG: hypothetical protein AAF050_15170 [Cyanobacteria bacterium J06649_5]
MKYFSAQPELPANVYPIDSRPIPQGSLALEMVGICTTLCTALLVHQIRLLIEVCKS